MNYWDAGKIGWTLFFTDNGWKSDLHRQTIENTQIKLAHTANSEVALLDDLTEVVRRHKPELHSVPYWFRTSGQALEYNPLEVLLTSIEFFDQHTSSIPRTTLPPIADVKEFITQVLNASHRVSIAEQLDILLTITKGDLMGAANLGMLGCRLIARGMDSRIYPELVVTPETLKLCNLQMEGFEDIDSTRNDRPGDNYYFWTHCFCAIAYRQLNCTQSDLFDLAFSNGTQIMTFVRKWIARQPTATGHTTSSELGRALGISLYHFALDTELLDNSYELNKGWGIES